MNEPCRIDWLILGFSGWFSLTNEDKNPTAIAYSSIVQLIQEQVYTFLSTTSIVGYIFNPEQLGMYTIMQIWGKLIIKFIFDVCRKLFETY